MSLSTWPAEADINSILKAGSFICGDGTKSTTTSLDLLTTRLEKFDKELNVSRSLPGNIQNLQLETALASLYVLERVTSALKISKPEAPPLIGTRDMAQLRTHLAIAMNWGIDLLLSRILPVLPTRRTVRLPPGAQIVDLTAAYADYTLLLAVLRRLLALPFPRGPDQLVEKDFVAVTVLNRGFTVLLRACIVIGWLPDRLRGDLPAAPELKKDAFALLNSVPPAQGISALGQILSRPDTTYVSKACSMAMSGQLVRPDANGVAGLLSATFGDDVMTSDAPLEKLEAVSRLLSTIPTKISAGDYFSLVIPRLLRLLTPGMNERTPPAHKRAASFALARIAVTTSEGNNAEQSIRHHVLSQCLLEPFKRLSLTRHETLPVLEERVLLSESHPSFRSLIEREATRLTPTDAIYTISTIIVNADPLPELLSALLGPIIPQLYTLDEHLRNQAAADPALRETISGLLATWARAASTEEVVDRLWDLVDKEASTMEWRVDDDGELRVYEREAELPALTLAQLADLQEGKDIEESEESNPLRLRPDPAEFAKFLRSLDRNDVSSALYSRILDAHLKDNNEDPMRKLLFLKLVMILSSQLGESTNDSSTLKPDVIQTLTFIKISLEYESTASEEDTIEGSALNRLLIVPKEDKEEYADGDSDDEDLAPGLEGVERSEHMRVTAVNLLLALLEQYPDLSPKTVPLLNEIYVQLEPLANSSSDALRPRAREARLTLTARLASDIPAGKGSESSLAGEESAQKKYQRALKLLQDPILPVRAHGLLLLRELVSPSNNKSLKPSLRKETNRKAGEVDAGPSMVQGARIAPPSVEPALVPAILSIFMQSVQDEDSYIFLNAVQGLAAMVDGFGKDVLRGLIKEYTKNLDGSAVSGGDMTTGEVDKRVRVGEALGQIIRRCGDALGGYVDIIIPPLFALVRASFAPTAIRTSAVSLLATAEDTNPVALSAYMDDLIAGMIDLVQIESVRAPTELLSSTQKLAGATDDRKKDDSKTRGGNAANDASRILEQHDSLPATANAHAHGSSTNKNVPSSGANKQSDTLDAQPTSTNTKLPPLRRGALHFLALLVRALLERAYEGNPPDAGVLRTLTSRGVSILNYVAATDMDGVVKVMARETCEIIEQLRRSALGGD